MRAFAAIVAATLRQLLGGRRIIALAAMALLPAGVLLALLAGEPNAGADRLFQLFHEAPLVILLVIVLPVISLVFGAGALGDERRDATLSFLLLRPVPRALVAGAKLLAAWAAAFAVVGTGGVAMSVTLGARTGNWGTLGPLLVAAALSTLAYTAVFLTLGYLTRHAVLVGLVYAFVWESGMTTAVSSLATVSLMRLGLSAYTALVPTSRRYLGELLGVVTPGVGGAAAKALVVALLAVAATAALLRSRDIT
jgi:ABC-2 type transport system permease protein